MSFSYAQDLVDFIHVSPTPWHAVLETKRRLLKAGFREIFEQDIWKLEPFEKVFVTRSGSTLAAFEIGSKAPHEAGFHLVGAHTDSPNLRVKPRGPHSKAGTHVCGVEPYGGVLYHTWLDRDLALAGRVFTLNGSRLESHLVDTKRAIARIPSLAIHLDRAVNSDGLKLNAQQHLPPALGLESGGAFEARDLFDALGINDTRGEVAGFDLCFYDHQAPTLAGLRNEFVHAARLDNLGMCHSAVQGLLGSSNSSGQSVCEHTRGIVLFDHEECGSQSDQGADSMFLRDTLARIVRAFPLQDVRIDEESVRRALDKSFVVSADMAHAIHPNYSDRHEPQHAPRMGAGPVIKLNNNQRYATDGETSAQFTRFCNLAGITPQVFVTRSDLACGTTIGPITSSMVGVRVVDVGNPMWSMHSCREMAGAADVEPMVKALSSFFDVPLAEVVLRDQL